MSIAELREKSKSLLARVPRDVLILFVLVLAALLCFGFGYRAGLDAERKSGILREASPLAAASLDEAVIASRGGTKYHLPWCAGVERILESNKIWFSSASAALAAGYTKAENCKGL